MALSPTEPATDARVLLKLCAHGIGDEDFYQGHLSSTTNTMASGTFGDRMQPGEPLDGGALRCLAEARPETLRQWDSRDNNALHLLCLNPRLTEEALAAFLETPPESPRRAAFDRLAGEANGSGRVDFFFDGVLRDGLCQYLWS